MRESSGQVYVADAGNDRVQRFDSEGSFELAFGLGVVAPGGAGDLGGGNEKQTVTITEPSGSIALRWRPGPFGPLDPTPPIPVNASAGVVQSALEAHPLLDPGDVVVSGAAGGPFSVEFTGRYAATDVELISAGGSEGLGYSTATTVPPTPAFEVCTVASECRPGSPGSASDGPGGELSAPVGIDVDQDSGEVYVREGDNPRVSVFDADGNWLRSFGWDTIATGAPGDLGDAFEVCTVASACSPGAAGSSAGQFGHLGEAPAGVALNQANGDLFVADPGNLRVNQYTPAGGFTRSFGWGVDTGSDQFEVCTAASSCKEGEDVELIESSPPANGQFVVASGEGNPRYLAIDSASSVLYAAQTRQGASNGSAHVFRFDTSATSAADLLMPLSITSATTPKFWVDDGWPSGALDQGPVYGAEVDPASGNLLLLTGFPEEAHVQEINTADEPATLVGRHAKEGPVPYQSGLVMGLGYSAAADRFYVSLGFAGGSDGGYRLLVLGGNPAPPVTATAGLAADVDKRSATLQGEVDPNGPAGVETRYRFEYRKESDSEWIRLHANNEIAGDGTAPLPVSQDFDEAQLVTLGSALDSPVAGTFKLTFASAETAPIAFDASAASVDAALEALADVGPGDVSVSGPAGGPWRVSFGGSLGLSDQPQLSGDGSGLFPPPLGGSGIHVLTLVDGRSLEAKTAYRYRITAYKPFGAGGEAVSNESSFTTTAAPPDVATVYPQARGEDTARLAGLINPNNSPTDYRFEYGETTAYGSSTPIPDGTIAGGEEQLVVAEIEGLKPNTTYHYRLVADNGTEEAPGDTTMEGADVTFSTRPPVPADPGRSFEMVTPPFKITRSTVAVMSSPGYNANPGLPALDGETVRWNVYYFPLLDDSGFPYDGERLITRRTAAGWVTEPLMTLTPFPEYKAHVRDLSSFAHSGDLETQAWMVGDVDKPAPILANEGTGPLISYTYKTGTGSAGWSGWIDNVDTQQVGSADQALINDDGSAMVRWGDYRGLGEDPGTPGDEDPSDEQQLGGDEGGETPYLQLNPPLGPKDLVSECNGAPTIETQTISTSATGGTFKLILNGKTSANTAFNASATTVKSRLENAPIALGVGNVEVAKAGPVWTVTFVGDLVGIDVAQIALDTSGLTGGGASVATVQDGGPDPAGTLIPARADNGTPADSSDDTIGTRGCYGGQVVSRRGAIVGARPSMESPPSAGVISGAAATAMANDGRRVFFAAPDPAAKGAVQLSSCQNATGPASLCPPQLFVRSYDSAGNADVRWISKPAPGMPTQAIGLLGPAAFEGASRDGSVVYFKTKTPLSADDPNGSGTPGPKTTGSASNSSWDLYRYELPADREEDPADGALTRISGGPAGMADPNTNPFGNGKGGAARFVSDDGRRAYFVTGAPIADADASPPKGGVTTPGGSASDSASRNLYLFDDTGASPEWRFVARIPFADDAQGANAYNQCASFPSPEGFQIANGTIDKVVRGGASCVRGVRGGEAIAFVTQGRLSEDDVDDSADVYLYDARSDELVRVSAPPPGMPGYPCDERNGKVAATCHGEFGFHSRKFSNYDAQLGWGGARQMNVAQEADGTISVFFQSRLSLLSGDENGDFWDVYRWREGELELISRGRAGHHSHYSGNSLDGEDVFIQTSDRIDPREVDDADYDIYDLRIGAGFPPSPQSEPCDVLALDCERAAQQPPALQPPTTRGLQGKGNPKEPLKCRKGKVRRNGRCVHRKRATRKRGDKKRAGKGQKGGRR